MLLQFGAGSQLGAARAHAGANGDDGDDEAAASQGPQRRRRAESMRSCRRRHSTPASNPPEEWNEPWQCEGNAMVLVGSSRGSANGTRAPASCQASCLCVFDIDRTLTGKQGATRRCRGNRKLDYYDEAYGGGRATLSALTAAGIRTTFCDGCHLGITSAGAGSGAHSDWNQYLLDEVMRGTVHDAFTGANPGAQKWSYGTEVHSPYVLKQGNKIKQDAVEGIRQWYGRHGVCISSDEVYFFGDRTENIGPFQDLGFNSREISCDSRDYTLYGGSGMVGLCGARPEEIRQEKGNVLCS